MANAVNARFVGYHNGLKVYAFRRPQFFCDDKAVFKGRHSDYHEGQKVYAAASECCEYKFPYTPEWLFEDHFPPYGISKLLTLRVTDTTVCTQFCGTEYDAEFDGERWIWQIGQIRVRLTPVINGDGSLVFSWDTVDTECPASILDQAHLTCTFPLRLSTLQIAPSSVCCDCCPNTTARIIADVRGYCNRRHMARFVGYRDGLKVYAYTNNCSQQACREPDCCGPDFHCQLQACFTATGGGSCACPGGCITLTPTTGFGGPTWEANPFGCDGHQWHFRVTCLGQNTAGAYEFEWQIDCDANCSSSGIAEVFADCTNGEFDIEFDIHVNCVEWHHPPAPIPACCDEGVYTYRVRLTKGCGYSPSKLELVEYPDWEISL